MHSDYRIVRFRLVEKLVRGAYEANGLKWRRDTYKRSSMRLQESTWKAFTTKSAQ